MRRPAPPPRAGPLSLYYRKDLFAKYHLQVPNTMAEYVQVAETLRKKAPDVYLADFPTNDSPPTGTTSPMTRVRRFDAGRRRVSALVVQ